MSFPALLTQVATITHVKAGAKDEYNMPTQDDSTSSAPTFVEPLGGTEDTVLRATGVASARGYFLPAVTLTKNDRIQVGSHVYECVEEPEVYFNPRTAQVHHLEVLLKEVT